MNTIERVKRFSQKSLNEAIFRADNASEGSKIRVAAKASYSVYTRILDMIDGMEAAKFLEWLEIAKLAEEKTYNIYPESIYYMSRLGTYRKVIKYVEICKLGEIEPRENIRNKSLLSKLS